jgi:hypothetical protein
VRELQLDEEISLGLVGAGLSALARWLGGRLTP